VATAFPYLLASAAYVVVVVAAAALTLPREQVRVTLLSGSIGLPAALFLPWLEHAYWSPARFGGRAWGIEDLLISFAVSALAWYLVALRFARRLGPPVPVPEAFRRSLRPGGAAAGVFLAGAWLRVDPMTALLLAYAAVVAGLLWSRPRDAALAWWGALSFAIAWFVLVRTTFAALPGFDLQWTAPAPWGVPVAGVPLGELAWAAAFGAFWPPFVARVLALPWVEPSRARHAAGLAPRRPLRPR
jgi:hypothetical protein